MKKPSFPGLADHINRFNSGEMQFNRERAGAVHPKKPKILIIVDGGNVVSVHSSEPMGGVQILDYDSERVNGKSSQDCERQFAALTSFYRHEA